MNLIQAVVLGVVQGLTEFLPISSSGHLVLFQQMFGLKEPALFFDVSVHVGTLVAVILFFRREIGGIFIALFRFLMSVIDGKTKPSDFRKNPEVKIATLIVAGSIPTAIIGLFFKSHTETIFSSITIVGCMLLVTGALLWFTKRIKKEGSDIQGFTFYHALFIGTVQGLAILPGMSRSGSTIAAGVFSGIERNLSARFSFLLSIPAILGAEILSIKDLQNTANVDFMITLAGTITAFVIGYLSLKILMFVVNKGQLHLFAGYCWIVGLIAIAAGFYVNL